MCWRVKPSTAHFEKLNTEHVCGCQTQQVIFEQMKESECLIEMNRVLRKKDQDIIYSKLINA